MGQPFGGKSLSRFNRPNVVEPGRYQVDIFANNLFITRTEVEFRAISDDKVAPCLSDQFLLEAGVLPDSLREGLDVKINRSLKISNLQKPGPADEETKQSFSSEPVCLALNQRLPGAESKFDLSALRLDLLIPQSLMVRIPRGYVKPEDLNAGETMGFSNYNINYYHAQQSQGTQGNSDYMFLGLNSGINLGLWRLRHQATYRYSDSGNRIDSKWQNINTYVQRAVPELNSELTLGETFTEGTLFSSLSFKGARLGTDDRMLPDSMRGYAPQIRGIATSNARVIVRQNGFAIYETNVSPGPFIIDDLGGASTAGDLEVEVVEADGKRSVFIVPFTSVPLSIRPGTYRYNITAGQTRNYGDKEANFVEGTYQYGLNNSITLNAGTRVAENYFAGLVGGVLATSYGAFGLNNTYSNSRVDGHDRQTGSRIQLTYGKSINPTGTNVSLAASRHSTQGFRDLVDILTIQNAIGNNTAWFSNSYQQRSQYTASINQSLAGYGQVFLSASTSDYYNNRSRNTQVQFGYSHVWNQVSYGLTYTRQNIKQDSQNNAPSSLMFPGIPTNQITSSSDHQVMLTLSFPLGSAPRSPYVSSSISRRSSGGTTYQSSMSGTLDESQDTTYSIDAMYDDDSNITTFGGSMQHRFPVATVGGNYSSSQDFWQASANARGAFVVHGGGVTLGPYLGDTFALIEAKGASGAEVRNGQGARINDSGYALVPTLMPYRYNDVSLQSDGINSRAELQENQRRVAPYAGATVKVQFKTIMGYALLIKARMPDGSQLPLGADVKDEQGKAIGMVGQTSQIYARAEQLKGNLRVQWEEDSKEGCTLPYDLTKVDLTPPLLRLDGVCTP